MCCSDVQAAVCTGCLGEDVLSIALRGQAVQLVHAESMW